ncbi:MAG: type 1 glutamine amidotransferase [Alphaproteobacteria bacterium]|nr:type 1 glutamine amidotransferase [Alphaproteobacteria bacterium]
MSSPRLLVVEGNTAEGRKWHAEAGGIVASENYANVLRKLCPGARIDICFPADIGANLPDRAGLEGYDGVAITGSALHIYDLGPSIMRQVDLARAVFETETPFFGSCWGLQVATVAAGGTVRKNPKGREIGFARGIMLTDAGEEHDLYWDKPPVFDAITVHLDEIEETARGTTILATNAVSAVQAAEIKTRRCTFWGVQYHPEYSFGDIAIITRRVKAMVIEQGLFKGDVDHASYVRELEALESNPRDTALTWRHGISSAVYDFGARTQELKNWIERQVLPTRSKRGRA